MKIVHAKTDLSHKKKVYAAGNAFEDTAVFGDADEEATTENTDFEDDEFDDTENEGIDDVTDDMGIDGQQDGSTIEIDNNIVNHLVAECQNCHGIFISAMLASDQIIESINGVCPLCSKDTEQVLRWIIKDYPE